jgi:hypothetical protein
VGRPRPFADAAWWIDPAVGSRRPAAIFKRVLFPEPLTPASATISPSRTWRLASKIS